MNVETLSAIADKKIELSGGSLRNFREKYLGLFKTHGFSETIPDSYKFTNLESFFSTLAYGPQNNESFLPVYQASFPTITFVDGEFSQTEELPSGVKLTKVKDHFNEVKELFKSSNALSNFHHAFMTDGVILEVAKNTEVKTPVRILNIITKSSIAALTHLVVAHPMSKITVVEETRASEVSHANVTETYLFAHVGASIEHIQVDREGENGINHGSVIAEVEQDATVRSFFLNTTGKLNRKNLELNLNAPGANGETFSLYLTENKEHSDINTVIHHRAPDTTSEQIAKGILDGESKAIFTGKIHIHPKAQRVVSSQLNKNLLLSKRAQVHSQPQLEIFADDVKCSHGSTTGQLSDDEVFYFQARGIPAERARTILAHGFGLEIVQKITNKKAREHVSAIIMENLSAKFNTGGIS